MIIYSVNAFNKLNDVLYTIYKLYTETEHRCRADDIYPFAKQ